MILLFSHGLFFLVGFVLGWVVFSREEEEQEL